MNTDLTSQIIKHIFGGFRIINSTFININSKSLISNSFLLNEKLVFDEDIQAIENNIWACQMLMGQQELKIILGDCSQENNIREIAMVAHLKDAPAYGLYLNIENDIETNPMIACSINGNDWMECNMYLQATFLAGMEQSKEMNMSWSKCQEYSEQHKML